MLVTHKDYFIRFQNCPSSEVAIESYILARAGKKVKVTKGNNVRKIAQEYSGPISAYYYEKEGYKHKIVVRYSFNRKENEYVCCILNHKREALSKKIQL